MSPATLRRKFIAATGVPPKALQLRLAAGAVSTWQSRGARLNLSPSYYSKNVN